MAALVSARIRGGKRQIGGRKDVVDGVGHEERGRVLFTMWFHSIMQALTIRGWFHSLFHSFPGRVGRPFRVHSSVIPRRAPRRHSPVSGVRPGNHLAGPVDSLALGLSQRIDGRLRLRPVHGDPTVVVVRKTPSRVGSGSRIKRPLGPY